MSDVGDNNFVRYIYRGEEDEQIPLRATHVTVHESVTAIRAEAFWDHRNIVEVICHDKVERIERYGFDNCRSLRRVIMPGVTIVEVGAFSECKALTDVECGKLERIGKAAFFGCCSLRSINLTSVEIVSGGTFCECTALTSLKFGNKLERYGSGAIADCISLERITIPLKRGLIADDSVFQGCGELNRVDLVEGVLHETVAALHLEGWRNDMNEEIDSINQILPDTNAGDDEYEYVGGKARAIRRWIRSVLFKLEHYKGEHQRLLNEEIATTLQLALPRDTVMNSVLPFLALPPHTFEEEDEDEDEPEEVFRRWQWQ